MNLYLCKKVLWQEDVVSHIGIWDAFDEECQKHYGKNVPFYNDETNNENLQFIIDSTQKDCK